MERVILVGLDLGKKPDFSHAMEELEQLAIACDMEVVGMTVQKLAQAHKATYIGSGKVEEIAELVEELEAELVIFDNGLSPMQLRNLQQALHVAVMDRTTLILEIFGKRAGTREAKLQVEVASLQYMMPRLVGLHDALSRQGGGSGSMSNKGAGEKKLELDRRYIESRLGTLRRELKQMEEDRQTQRKKRIKSGIPLVSLVGYTNAGKSSVMNRLVDYYNGEEEKKVLEKDMLFATLDTTVRKMNGPDGKTFLLSDTVGFVSDLPHSLVKAFRSTLEEAKHADLLIQVCDFSDEYVKDHIKVTRETLKELGASDIPMLRIFNKMDRTDHDPATYPQIVGKDIYMAAGAGIGIKELAGLIEETLYGGRKVYAFTIPFGEGALFNLLKQEAQVMKEEYTAEGIAVEVSMDEALAGRCRHLLPPEEETPLW